MIVLELYIDDIYVKGKEDVEFVCAHSNETSFIFYVSGGGGDFYCY